MSKQIKMIFWRDIYTESGCLEYSWIPEGLRHNIQLLPGMQEDQSSDTIDDELNPSHVQVYVATNNNAVGIEMWQFPSGSTTAGPIEAALVEIFERRNQIIGTVFYSDGTMVSTWSYLKEDGRKCPQEVFKNKE